MTPALKTTKRTRPWVVRYGTPERSFQSRESAIGYAVSRAYRSSIWTRIIVENVETRVRAVVEHLEGHRVIIKFHAKRDDT